MPTDKIHIKVPQDRTICPKRVDNKKKQVFEIFHFKCVTRPDLSEVPLKNNIKCK